MLARFSPSFVTFGSSPGASLGATFALLAALSWGGGDFAGGMGSKAAGGTTPGTLRMMICAHAMSLTALLVCLAVQGGVVLHGWAVVWGLGAGVVAGLSLAAFYIALARGAMGASAAVSGLLAAAIPAAIGIVLEGRPSTRRVVGFAVAAVAIWFIAAPEPSTSSDVTETSGTMGLAIGGGIGFGLYFAGLKFANSLGVIEPLALSRTGSIVTSLLLLFVLREQPSRNSAGELGHGWLSRAGWMWAAGVALLDTGGNLLYIAATRAGRLDIAAVLASFYPASTILLAAALLHERPGRRQLAGMGLAAAAIAMVTL